MNKGLKKRCIFVVMSIMLLLIGFIIGSYKMNDMDDIKLVDISNDTSYDNLTKIQYKVNSKFIKEISDGFEGNFSIIIMDELKDDELFELGKAFYETTVSKQRDLKQVNISFYLWEIKSETDNFYNENLLYRINYEKPLNRIVTSKYILDNNIEEDVNRITWVINNICKNGGTIDVDISMQDNVSDGDMLSQAKGLITQIRELNSSINQDDCILLTISNSTNNTLLYNSKFEGVYVKSNYRNII